MKELGSRIKRLRNDNGYTQDELGKKLNVTRQAVSSWERDRTEPDLDLIMNICNLFSVPLNYFQDETVERKNYQSSYVVIFTSLLLLIGFASNIWTKHASSTNLVAIVIWLCSIITYYSLHYAMTNHEFSNIAGYDRNVDINDNILVKVLNNISIHVTWASLITIFLVYSFSIFVYELKSINDLLMLSYFIDMVVYIIFVNHKNRDELYKNDIDITKASKSSYTLIIFLIYMCVCIVLMANGSNSPSGSISFSGAILIATMISSTIGLIVEDVKIKKISDSVVKYNFSNTYKTIYGLNTAFLLFLILNKMF